MAGTDSIVIALGVDSSATSIATVDWVLTEARLRHGEISPSRAGVIGPFASVAGDGGYRRHIRESCRAGTG